MAKFSRIGFLVFIFCLGYFIGQFKYTPTQVLSVIPVKQDHFETVEKPRFLLMGLFCSALDFERRSLIRSTWGFQPPKNVHIYFVVARPKDRAQASLLAFETSAHNDILYLDGPENMDDGKTMWFFQAVSKEKEFDFVMKADIDTFIHIPNLVEALQKAKEVYRRAIYFGRVNYNPKYGEFHAGMGYALSWDLVQFMANDPYCIEHSMWQEDTMVAKCLQQPNILEFGMIQPDNPEAFYDEPYSNKPWSHEYTKDTILIHQLKRTDWFLKACMWFMPERMPTNARLLLGDHKWSPSQSNSFEHKPKKWSWF
ncbi:hypothetical protein EDD86DRAFT_247731 [Gorgonomyces haynaldii]|nr:hypothetical protein EDD86DRAFT_247731 [Gorgonomyces haynaldii]